MGKKLNIDSVRSELSEGSAFFPSYKRDDSPAPITTDIPAVSAPQSLIQQPKQLTPERMNARPPVRPNQKRIITRNSFEIYEDQMDSLRKLSYLEKMDGRIGSMSAMVREAIDSYLKEKSSNS